MNDIKFKVKEVGSGDFYLDDIYEDNPAYVHGSNIPIDSGYNVPNELPYAYDID